MTSALRGGGGVGPKADRVIKLSKGGCVNLRTKSQNFADVICVWPLRVTMWIQRQFFCPKKGLLILKTIGQSDNRLQ